MAARSRPETRERLIEAAGSVFAEQGYRGATMREIADRAGANLAAAHYHFGSKQDLYRAVVRAPFERLEQRLAAVGAADPQRMSRDELVALLRARVRALFETLLEPSGIHARLMQRELADPTTTLSFVVRRWIDPLRSDMVALLGRLAPGLPAARLEFCARSLMGQVIFYFTHRPALLVMMQRRSYPPDFADAVTEHVVAFTLGGLEGLQCAEQPGRARPQRLREARTS